MTEHSMITLATAADVDELLVMHHRVFNAETHYAIHLGERFMRCVMEWYCKAPNQFTLLARRENRLVGYVCLNLGTYNEVFWSNKIQAIQAIIRKPAILLAPPILRRIRGLVRTRPAKQGEPVALGYLALIAVYENAGVPHLGTTLVKAALSEASIRGWSAIATATRHDNLAAQGLFKKTGFHRIPDADADNLLGFRISLSSNGA